MTVRTLRIVSLVNTLMFADTVPSPCLWVGTTLGSVLVIPLGLPEGDGRKSNHVIVSPSGKYQLSYALVSSTNLHLFPSTVCLLILHPIFRTSYCLRHCLQPVSFSHLLTSLSSVCPYSILWAKVFRILRPFYLELQVCSPDNVSTFRSRTKTHLFRLAH